MLNGADLRDKSAEISCVFWHKFQHFSSIFSVFLSTFFLMDFQGF
jgi:hypothetical protein